MFVTPLKNLNWLISTIYLAITSRIWSTISLFIRQYHSIHETNLNLAFKV